MAGYMRKLNGYVYDGANQAYAELPNGIFAEIGANGVVAITAAGDMELRVEEKTTLWGLPAQVLNVVIAGDKEQYFVENDLGNMENDPTYDGATYTCKVGDYVRMHRPLIGEQLIMTVDSTVYDAVAVGNTVKPAIGGSVAKKS